MPKIPHFVGSYFKSNTPAEERPEAIHLQGLGIVKIRPQTEADRRFESSHNFDSGASFGMWASFVPGPDFNLHLRQTYQATNWRLKRLPTALCLLGVMLGTAALTSGVMLAAPIAIGLGAAAIVVSTALMFRTRPYAHQMHYQPAAECFKEASLAEPFDENMWGIKPVLATSDKKDAFAT